MSEDNKPIKIEYTSLTPNSDFIPSTEGGELPEAQTAKVTLDVLETLTIHPTPDEEPIELTGYWDSFDESGGVFKVIDHPTITEVRVDIVKEDGE